VGGRIVEIQVVSEKGDFSDTLRIDENATISELQKEIVKRYGREKIVEELRKVGNIIVRDNVESSIQISVRNPYTAQKQEATDLKDSIKKWREQGYTIFVFKVVVSGGDIVTFDKDIASLLPYLRKRDAKFQAIRTNDGYLHAIIVDLICKGESEHKLLIMYNEGYPQNPPLIAITNFDDPCFREELTLNIPCRYEGRFKKMNWAYFTNTRALTWKSIYETYLNPYTIIFNQLFEKYGCTF